MSSIIALLLVVSAIVFAVGVGIERSQGHTEAVSTTGATTGVSATPVEGSAEGEAAEHPATASTTTEAAVAETGHSDSETLFGVNTESIPLVIFAVLVSVALAAAVLFSPRPPVLALILAIALAAVAFDVREAIHQSNESRETVMALAITAAALHGAAAVFAGVALLRRPRALLSGQPG